MKYVIVSYPYSQVRDTAYYQCGSQTKSSS